MSSAARSSSRKPTCATATIGERCCAPSCTGGAFDPTLTSTSSSDSGSAPSNTCARTSTSAPADGRQTGPPARGFGNVHSSAGTRRRERRASPRCTFRVLGAKRPPGSNEVAPRRSSKALRRVSRNRAAPSRATARHVVNGGCCSSVAGSTVWPRFSRRPPSLGALEAPNEATPTSSACPNRVPAAMVLASDGGPMCVGRDRAGKATSAVRPRNARSSMSNVVRIPAAAWGS